MSRRHNKIQNEIDHDARWINGVEIRPKKLKAPFFNKLISSIIIKITNNKKGYLARRKKYELSIKYEIRVIK
jgi:hypothetical protein